MTKLGQKIITRESPGSVGAWYWRRLRAMHFVEVGAHVRKKLRQLVDGRGLKRQFSLPSPADAAFPRLPAAGNAPLELRAALEKDRERILSGEWHAFGHLPIRVDDPPHWHRDYFAGREMNSNESAFRMNHRALPGGADVKMIWELSRWYCLTRLAEAAYVLEDRVAFQTTIRWFESWVQANPCFRGLNWTSALEAGMRLVQFTWIDGLLTRSCAKESGVPSALHRLRNEIVPAHCHFAWRYLSVGSSANNHLLGELTGLIVAISRWPTLESSVARLPELQKRWENEVLKQFAADGGNREQALNYHLFSWEFCWHARAALRSVGQKVSTAVEQRLKLAAEFFVAVQSAGDHWDFGDSDNAYVTPFFAQEEEAIAEMRAWLMEPKSSPAVAYWMEDGTDWSPPEKPSVSTDWRFFPDSGLAVRRTGRWFLRWDLSPLGYLSTAAHGHLDALHLSLWLDNTAMIIDPGTGAYYAEPELRTYLASAPAHNGPRSPSQRLPDRRGPFLWSGHHRIPELLGSNEQAALAELPIPGGTSQRRIILLEADRGWRVEDSVMEGSSPLSFFVRWQFPPGSEVRTVGETEFRIMHQNISLSVVVENWSRVELCLDRKDNWEGWCSSHFREKEFAPYLLLSADGHKSCVFATTFLASPRS